MTYCEIKDGDPICLAIQGELSVDAAAEARSAALEIFETGAEAMIVDLSEVTSIASPGVGFVATLHHSAEGKGIKVIFMSPAPFVLEVLKVTGLAEILNFAADADEAAKMIQG
ncbi:MAG: STAS domain-containing protein [Candidatus Lindowbacteria bacterium]|nr:STAS domain-containing protein [Candidatus Lindowbacteria bacterium]